MEKWEMMRVRTEGVSGLGYAEHFKPDEWSEEQIEKDESLGEKNHWSAVRRFIMGLLNEGWEPLSIYDSDPTFGTKRTFYLFRRPWRG